MNVFIKSNAPLYLPPGKTMKTSHILDLVQTRIYCLLLKHYYHFQKFQSISWEDNYSHTCCWYCWQFLLEWIQYGIFVRIYVSKIFKALTSQLQNSKDLTIYLFLYNFGNRLKKNSLIFPDIIPYHFIHLFILLLLIQLFPKDSSATTVVFM